ncbi:unnamed protein product, partial [Prorocentrum cordatum]
ADNSQELFRLPPSADLTNGWDLTRMALEDKEGGIEFDYYGFEYGHMMKSILGEEPPANGRWLPPRAPAPPPLARPSSSSSAVVVVSSSSSSFSRSSYRRWFERVWRFSSPQRDATQTICHDGPQGSERRTRFEWILLGGGAIRIFLRNVSASPPSLSSFRPPHHQSSGLSLVGWGNTLVVVGHPLFFILRES